MQAPRFFETLQQSRADGSHLKTLASQCPISEWYPNIGDPTLTDAICDRLVHYAYKIELRGDSMRIKSSAGNRKNERNEAIANDSRLS